jgi:hypothetical protein
VHEERTIMPKRFVSAHFRDSASTGIRLKHPTFWHAWTPPAFSACRFQQLDSETDIDCLFEDAKKMSWNQRVTDQVRRSRECRI